MTSEKTHTATYSPEDNKLRLYPAYRLPADDYAKVRAAGFVWAPKQELFVAPTWTPDREDLLIEMCGEVGDEDTSLVERASVRAERFEDYSEKRLQDAENARESVAAVAGNIPFGQPILIGHHSEKRARKDAEKINKGMNLAVKMWRTSKYWTDRAAGAIHHAKYKELPAVRARRIKRIVAEKRAMERAIKERAACLELWETCPEMERARYICGWTRAGHLNCVKHPTLDQYLHPSDVLPFEDRSEYAREHYPTWTLEQVKERARIAYRPSEYQARWIEHYDNRIAYETAMLNEQGRGDLIAPKARPKQLPLVNYRAESVRVKMWGELKTLRVVEMTAGQYKGIYENYRATAVVENSHRVRIAIVDKTDVTKRFPAHDNSERAVVFLTDSKVHKKPEPIPDVPKIAPPLPPARVQSRQPAEPSVFDKMADMLREGAAKGGAIQVVAAPQLFPTPAELAERMADAADLTPGDKVLEPSAGTGSLLRAISERGIPASDVTAVEINPTLADGLSSLCGNVVCGDFLDRNGDIGTFDRVIMNPPFSGGADIKHIRHAVGMLNPGGRIVALCADGPRQREILKPIAEDSGGYYEELPEGTFKEQGTNVNTALVVIESA